MDIKDDVFGFVPESKNRVYKELISLYLIGIFLFTSAIFNTAYAKPPSFSASSSSLINKLNHTSSFGLPPYIFDTPFTLSQRINSELRNVLSGVKVRIISGGILSPSDFDEWTHQMGKDNTVKYQQAFYAAFAGDSGPKSLSNIRVTDRDGEDTMNCVISHPNTDWHVTWEVGGVNMSMNYGDKDYNLNDVSEFILYHESKHCISNNNPVIINENLSDAFAALIYRSKNNGQTAMINDIIGFRHYQIKNTVASEDRHFKQAAHDHDSRNTLQKIIDLDFKSDIQGLSIVELNELANSMVSHKL